MQYADICLKYVLKVISMKKTPSFSNTKRDSDVQSPPLLDFSVKLKLKIIRRKQELRTAIEQQTEVAARISEI